MAIAQIPHEQEFELYHYGESLCSQMVRIALAEKSIPYKSRSMLLCEISTRGENLSPAYLAVNPRGVVPTLVHKGVPVYDSWEIIKYLDRRCPDSEPRLWPDDADRQQRIEEWVHENSLRDDVTIGSTFGTAIPVVSSAILSRLLNKQPLFHVMWKYRNHPVKSRRLAFYVMRLSGGIPSSLLKKGVQSLARGLLQVEARLAAGGPCLLGDFCQIDVMMMAHFHRLEDVHLGAILDDTILPHTTTYWRNLQARPSYRLGVLDWHEANWRQAMEDVFGNAPSPLLDDLREAVYSAGSA